MNAWTIAGGAVAVAIWAYLLLLRGGFWRVAAVGDAVQMAALQRREPAGKMPALPAELRRIVAVIPARTEAAVIGESVESLLRQSFAGTLTVIVVDDNSTDGTADIARGAAEECQAGERLTVIAASEPPAGWTGKLWAVQQGIEVALRQAPDFLLLTDADIRHAGDSVARLVARADNDARDLVSHMVRLRCSTLAERLLIPAFVYFFFLLYPPRWTADPRRPTAGAAGGCMLLRPAALGRAGGIAAVRGEIIDDCALAEAVKRGGGRLWLQLADGSESLRGYGSFAEIAHMIARTAFSQLRHSTLLLIACVAGLAITFLLPLALLGTGRPGVILGGCAWLLMTISYAPMVRYYRLNLLWSLTLPLAAVFYLGATVQSALRFWSGRGGQWKGRVQDWHT